MKKKTLIALSCLLCVAMILGACSLPKKSEMTEEQFQLFAQATLTKMAQGQTTAQPTIQDPNLLINTPTPLPALPNPTTIPSATALPTIPVLPTATQGVVVSPPLSTTDANRISFAPGTTNAIVDGSVKANNSMRFVFRIAKGQLLDLSVYSPGKISIAVSSAAGTKLVDFSKGWTWYRDYLQEAGDWYVDIRADGADANFSLFLSIPQRLSFTAGTNSLKAQATIPNGRLHTFLVWGNKGQTIKLNVSPNSNIYATITHVDGSVVLSPMGTLSSFEGTLPLAGDYMINVVVRDGAGSTAINMDLSIQ